jgi:hypothetical protein
MDKMNNKLDAISDSSNNSSTDNVVEDDITDSL